MNCSEKDALQSEGFQAAACGRFAAFGVALFVPLEWPVLIGAEVQAAV
jgi:hypothetical protein